MILSSVPGKTLKIGQGAVLSAGSVVVIKDVPEYTLVGGVPAKPIAKVTIPMTFNTSYENFKNGLVPFDK